MKSNCNDVKIVVAPNRFVNSVAVTGITNLPSVKMMDAKGSIIKVINKALNTQSINTTANMVTYNIILPDGIFFLHAFQYLPDKTIRL